MIIRFSSIARSFLVLFALLGCCGCGGGNIMRGGNDIPSKVFTSSINDGADEYKLGYSDGCNNAKAMFSGDKVVLKKKVSEVYNNGWVRGKARCTEQGIEYLQGRYKQSYAPAKSKSEENERQMIWHDLKK